MGNRKDDPTPAYSPIVIGLGGYVERFLDLPKLFIKSSQVKLLITSNEFRIVQRATAQ
jgi:hypothetical protein